MTVSTTQTSDHIRACFQFLRIKGRKLSLPVQAYRETIAAEQVNQYFAVGGTL
jgi:hypothetical protein